jgi:tripartite-type tricarboxylate transporter receptor subunit TctC
MAETLRKQGYDVQVKQSRILLAPKGTPADIVAKLEKATIEAMNNKDLQESIAKVGDVFDPLTGEKLMQMIKRTEQELGPVVKANAAEMVAGQQ